MTDDNALTIKEIYERIQELTQDDQTLSLGDAIDLLYLKDAVDKLPDIERQLEDTVDALWNYVERTIRETVMQIEFEVPPETVPLFGAIDVRRIASVILESGEHGYNRGERVWFVKKLMLRE